jgi:hypothetical protein
MASRSRSWARELPFKMARGASGRRGPPVVGGSAFDVRILDTVATLTALSNVSGVDGAAFIDGNPILAEPSLDYVPVQQVFVVQVGSHLPCLQMTWPSIQSGRALLQR